MRFSILLGISVVCVSYGMDNQGQLVSAPRTAVMAEDGEQQYLLHGSIQDEQGSVRNRDPRSCGRRCCDEHGAEIGMGCCVLCAVGTGVSIGYFTPEDSTEIVFNSFREFLEWIRGLQ